MDKNWLRTTIIYASILLLFGLLILAWDLYQLIRVPMLSAEAKPVVIEVSPASTANHLVSLLKDKGLIQSSKLLKTLIKAEGISHALKAGIYEIKAGETAAQLLKRIVAGEVLTENFLIIEGSSAKAVAAALAEAPYLRYSQDDWQSIKGNHPRVEGLILADTYRYDAGRDAKSLLVKAHQELEKVLQENWQSRNRNLPYQTPYELLIAASIIEKETAVAAERYLISGVMVNRLKVGMPLQMDPTVVYALGDQYKGKLSKADLKINSPYNTYKYPGLPPTPIAMVGKAAIEAAAHPRLTDYYYFVARGDGSHQFSETYEQHRRAVLRYQKREIG